MNAPAIPTHVLASVLWHSHLARPAEPTAALIAVPPPAGDPEAPGPCLLDGLYIWEGTTWAREADGAPLPHAVFWWCDEADLLLGLEPMCKVAP